MQYSDTLYSSDHALLKGGCIPLETDCRRFFSCKKDISQELYKNIRAFLPTKESTPIALPLLDESGHRVHSIDGRPISQLLASPTAKLFFDENQNFCLTQTQFNEFLEKIIYCSHRKGINNFLGFIGLLSDLPNFDKVSDLYFSKAENQGYACSSHVNEYSEMIVSLRSKQTKLSKKLTIALNERSFACVTPSAALGKESRVIKHNFIEIFMQEIGADIISSTQLKLIDLLNQKNKNLYFQLI